MRRHVPAGGPGGTRRLVGAVLAAAVAVMALLLTSCTNEGLALARQACAHVDASLQLYHRASRDPDPAAAAAQRHRATEELEAALPLAAAANSSDPQWNPLMTTLQELGRNSEAHLVTALRAQCTQAAQPNEQAPVVAPVPPPTTPTGPPTTPTSPPTTPTGPPSTPATLPGQ
ncbi:MAG: hypothetical protein ACRDY3_04750 [Acidimicrobiales bacterium]